jgi:hypothetical protein
MATSMKKLFKNQIKNSKEQEFWTMITFALAVCQYTMTDKPSLTKLNKKEILEDKINRRF